LLVFFILKSVSVFFYLFCWVQFFKPAVEIAHDVVRRNLGSSLQLTVHSVIVYLLQWVHVGIISNVQADNLDSILFLVDVVPSLKHFTKATLPNLDDVLKLLLESAGIEDVKERRVLRDLADILLHKAWFNVADVLITTDF
jgi:hypothetical protein